MLGHFWPIVWLDRKSHGFNFTCGPSLPILFQRVGAAGNPLAQCAYTCKLMGVQIWPVPLSGFVVVRRRPECWHCCNGLVQMHCDNPDRTPAILIAHPCAPIPSKLLLKGNRVTHSASGVCIIGVGPRLPVARSSSLKPPVVSMVAAPYFSPALSDAICSSGHCIYSPS